MGPGGLSRERAGFEVRDVHSSHYGRMCPIETPEGPNIGLIGHLATYGRINEYGFIETPYRRVVEGKVTDEITYLAADEEEEYVIAQANAKLAPDGTLTDQRVLVRRAPQGPGVRVGAGGTTYGTTSEVDFVPPSEVDLMDVSPKQIISISTALIPFIEHDDANRALMGANMQKQAVPLVRPEAPFVGTGVEGRAARDTGDVLLAEGTGTVVEVSGEHVIVEYKEGQADRYGRPLGAQGLPRLQVPPFQPEHLLQPAHRGRGRPTGGPGRRPGRRPFHRGRASSAWARTSWWPSCPGRATTTRTPSSSPSGWSRTTCLSSIHIEEHEVDARDTKLGAEEITRDIPNLSEEILKDLDERGIIRIGAEVGCRRRAGGQGHPQGRDGAHPRGAPAEGHLRRKGPGGAGHLAQGAPR